MLTTGRALASNLLRVGAVACHSAEHLVHGKNFATEASPSSNARTDAEDLKATASKLAYRSKQRGFLELDLIVGLWAEKAIPKMDRAQLKQLAVVLDQENPDLFKWLTGQLPPPDEMMQNPVFVALREDTLKQLAANSSVRTRAVPGQDWVRGWDDAWRKSKSQSSQPLQ